MKAFEFNSIISDGIIRIPKRYRNKLSNAVKVIPLSDEVPSRLRVKDF